MMKMGYILRSLVIDRFDLILKAGFILCVNEIMNRGQWGELYETWQQDDMT